MFFKSLLIISIVSLFGFQIGFGFDCYKCATTTTDRLCLTNPESISSGDVTVNCTGYCTILRTEFTDVPGQVISFVRDCEDKPLVLNEIRTDAHYTKYYRSCTTNKCNSGNGIIGSGSNGNVSSDIILVPENGASTTKTVSAHFVLILGILISAMNMM